MTRDKWIHVPICSSFDRSMLMVVGAGGLRSRATRLKAELGGKPGCS